MARNVKPGMSIEIDVLNGDASWPLAEPLLNAVWSPDIAENRPWGHIKWAHADLRVLIEAPSGGLACHVGIYFRTVTWNGRQFHIGGIGGVSTREGLPAPRLCQHRTQRGDPDHARQRRSSVRAAVLRAAQFRILSIARLASVRRRNLRRTTPGTNSLRRDGAFCIRFQAGAAAGRHRPMRAALVTMRRHGWRQPGPTCSMLLGVSGFRRPSPSTPWPPRRNRHARRR
jgi:hypothetical protein